MQQIMGYMRKAITDYGMISPGDRILVGVSGGKDSLALLCGLARLRGYLGVPYSLQACTLDMGFAGPDAYAPVAGLCRTLDVPYLLKKSDIGDIVFRQRQEANPCSLCARMRRGALHDAAKALQCNKVALGHHADDAAQTLLMNLFDEGRIGCFSPVTYLSRKDLTVIRPLIYAPEREIAHAARVAGLPVVSSGCPADKHTERERVKEWLASQEKERPGITARVYGALQRSHVSGW